MEPTQCCKSVSLLLLFSHPVVSDSLRSPWLQHPRLPCPSPSPGVGPSSSPLHQWCHPAISSSYALFSFFPQSLLKSVTFPMSQLFASVQFTSVAQSCPVLCDPMDCSTSGFPVPHRLLEFVQVHVHWVGDSIQPSHPLSSPSPPASGFPNTRVFSNESALHIRWPKYWSFSFSISPSKFSGLISFRFDWFDLLAVQETLKSLL